MWQVVCEKMFPSKQRILFCFMNGVTSEGRVTFAWHEECVTVIALIQWCHIFKAAECRVACFN